MRAYGRWLLLVAFLIGLGAGVRLRAHACDCVPDGFWVLGDPMVDANDAALWPPSGHVYPDRLSLWGHGQGLALEYAP
jgi:hypothetical protein